MPLDKLIEVVIVMGVVMGGLIWITKTYAFEWIPESKAKLKPSLRTIECDCDAETECPQGRSPEQRRCVIFKQDRSDY